MLKAKKMMYGGARNYLVLGRSFEPIGIGFLTTTGLMK